MNPPIDQLTPQGYDMTFGTNVIGHYLFLRLVYPLLVSSTTTASPSRIVWVASSGHYYADAVDFATLRDGPQRRAKSTFGLYAQSKFAQVMLTYHMRKQCEADGIVVGAVDPGNIRSEVLRTTPLFTRFMIWAVQVCTSSSAVLSVLNLKCIMLVADPIWRLDAALRWSRS